MRSLKSAAEWIFESNRVGEIKVIAHPGGEESSRITFGEYSSAVIAVGSEGGFNKRELDLFLNSGFMAVGLGPRVVRVEVAVMYLLGQSLGIT
jgi:RsmE family RNA methyltransferase